MNIFADGSFANNQGIANDLNREAARDLRRNGEAHRDLRTRLQSVIRAEQHTGAADVFGDAGSPFRFLVATKADGGSHRESLGTGMSGAKLVRRFMRPVTTSAKEFQEECSF